MRLEEQVVNLELSKKLKELGVKQESLWYFIKEDDNEWSVEIEEYWDKIEGEWGAARHMREDMEYISAFTVAELGEMLPEFLEIDEKFKECSCKKTKKRISFKILLLDIKKSGSRDEWLVRYIRGNEVPYWERSYTEANARAKMLIYLLENNLISPKE